MNDKAMELFAAASELLPFWEASTDKTNRPYWMDATLSRAERLRREADDIEARDAAILKFRAAMAAFGEGQPNG